MAAEPPRSCLRKRGQPRRPSAPDRAVVTGRVFVAPTPGAPEAGEAAGEAGPPPPCRADAGGGWQASWQASASALLKYDVKAFARGVLDDANEVAGRVRPWAVRGEAYQDQSQNCSCVALVQCGVRMRLPMKIFAHNFVELVHGSTRVAVCADAAGALRRWAVLSLDMVNDRRAGRPAWSGWSSYDRSGADLPESIVQREEWDWTYRTDYAPSVQRGAGEHGQMLRRWEALRPLGRGPPRPGEAVEDAAPEQPLQWQDAPTDEEAAGEEAEAAWSRAAGAVSSQVEVKLFEDYLDELGLALYTARLTLRQRGWELRLRWWAVVNPQDEALRGVSQCMLRDTTLRALHDGDFVTKDVEERRHTSIQAPADLAALGDLLDADAMSPQMAVLEPRPPRQRLRLGGGPGGSCPAAAAAPASPDGAPGAAAAAAATPVALGLPSLAAPCLAAEDAAAEGLAVVGDAEAGSLLALAGGRAAWRATGAHEGLVAVALCAGPAAGGALVLSAGDDGRVRGWRADDGRAAGCCKIEGAVKPDSERRGLCVVQCVAAAGGADLRRAAAAAGRSVFSLAVAVAAEGGGLLLGPSARPRPALPSAVTALCFGAGGACLAAGTTSAGVFLWHPAQLADAGAAPAQQLPCSSSFVSLALAGPQDRLLCCAGSTDATLRLWQLPFPEPARDRRPMTFGGLGGKVRSFGVLAGAAPDEPVALALADGAAGAVAWRLSGARLGGDGSLGVDMRRGERLPPPPGRQVLAVALWLHGGLCRLACGLDDGSASVAELGGDGWRLAYTCAVPPAAPLRAGAAGARGGALVAARGRWLYAGAVRGELRAWELRAGEE